MKVQFYLCKKSYSLLKPKGKHGFIIPKPFIYSSSWAKIRELLLNEINTIVDCGKVWDNVKLEQIIYFINKNIDTSFYSSLILKK